MGILLSLLHKTAKIRNTGDRGTCEMKLQGYNKQKFRLGTKEEMAQLFDYQQQQHENCKGQVWGEATD